MRIVNVEGKNFDYLCDACGHLEPKKSGNVHYLTKSNGHLFKVYECPACGVLQRERRHPYEQVNIEKGNR